LSANADFFLRREKGSQKAQKKPWRGITGMEEFRPKRENRAKAEKK